MSEVPKHLLQPLCNKGVVFVNNPFAFPRPGPTDIIVWHFILVALFDIRKEVDKSSFKAGLKLSLSLPRTFIQSLNII